jgi:hypothetical protein
MYKRHPLTNKRKHFFVKKKKKQQHKSTVCKKSIHVVLPMFFCLKKKQRNIHKVHVFIKKKVLLDKKTAEEKELLFLQTMYSYLYKPLDIVYFQYVCFKLQNLRIFFNNIHKKKKNITKQNKKAFFVGPFKKK